MKNLAIICEFNPFHNGHKYIIEQAKRLSGCDNVICIMSGSFTQRGEICRTDKFLRAKHAVLCGADAVIELPAPFAVAPAEIFARGAINVLSSVKNIEYLAFGCECGSAEDIICAARVLNEESEKFKKVLIEKLDGGQSYIKSYCAAFSECGGKAELLNSPNNILAVEYAKAIAKRKSAIKLLPIKRVGSDFNDSVLRGEFSSATAIRANADNIDIKDAMPICSFDDFIKSTDNSEKYKQLTVDWLFMCDKAQLKRVYGCTEGLENRLKALAEGNSFDIIVTQATTKRYSASRITRILAANLLKLYSEETKQILSATLIPKVLAIKKEKTDSLLPQLTASSCQNEENEKCESLTSSAYALWRHLSAPLLLDNPNGKMLII